MTVDTSTVDISQNVDLLTCRLLTYCKTVTNKNLTNPPANNKFAKEEVKSFLFWNQFNVTVRSQIGLAMRSRIHAVHADDAQMKILMRISRILRQKRQ